MSSIQNHNFVFNDKDMKLQTPFKLLISGPSGCGKSYLTQQIIQNNYFDKEMSEVILCVPKNSLHLLSESLSMYRTCCPKIQIFEGLIDPSALHLYSTIHQKLIIFDDMAFQLFDDPRINDLMVFSARKANFSSIIITQNLYQSSRFGLSIRQSCQIKWLPLTD